MYENSIYSYFNFGGGGFSIYEKEKTTFNELFNRLTDNTKFLLLVMIFLQIIILIKK
jgi:hypothetical protein